MHSVTCTTDSVHPFHTQDRILAPYHVQDWLRAPISPAGQTPCTLFAFRTETWWHLVTQTGQTSVILSPKTSWHPVTYGTNYIHPFHMQNRILASCHLQNRILFWPLSLKGQNPATCRLSAQNPGIMLPTCRIKSFIPRNQQDRHYFAILSHPINRKTEDRQNPDILSIQPATNKTDRQTPPHTSSIPCCVTFCVCLPSSACGMHVFKLIFLYSIMSRGTQTAFVWFYS